jgi:hypothetical protein
VQVLPRVIQGGSPDLELNGLLLSKNPIISASTMVLEFPSTATVGAYFGIDSPEYSAADVYFTSYDNKFSSPHSFFVARRIDVSVAAWLRSAKNTKTVANFKAITDGAFVISIDNTAYTVEGLDFSSVTSFSDAAATIQAALVTAGATGATVTYSSLTQAFTITSGTTGASSEVGYASAPTTGTDISVFIGLTEASGAVDSIGMDALTPAAQMIAIRKVTENWVTFTTEWEVDAAEAMEWSAWAATNYGYIYIPWSTDPNLRSQDSSIDMASVLKEAGHPYTAKVEGTLEYAAFAMGVQASIDWNRTNGTITSAFKKQAGLAPRITDELEALTLESKTCNYFGNFATRNAEFKFLYPGVLNAGDWGFIDALINSIWLNNRLQVALMDGLSGSGRAPYSPRGYNMVAAWMIDPINQARNNGAIEAGIVLSERQKTEVQNEAGLDISSELFTQGYYIQVLDPGASVRALRESPIINLWYTYGGAIHKLDVASTAIL